jgi:hypothetical protein
MIHVETITLNGRRYTRTYSDTHYIERDGVEYEEAIDPIDSGRVYTESKTPLPELTDSEALDIIVNGGGGNA